MQVMGLEIGEIAELASDVAIAGAIRLTGAMGDELFEYIVAIAAVIYEMHPDA